MPRSSLFLPLLFAGLAALSGGPVRAADEPKSSDVQAHVDSGLRWLASVQNKGTGSWEANGGAYPVTMTGLAGMTFLMDGNTLREGKYSANVRRAVEWLLQQAQPNGLIGNPHHPSSAGHYTYGHGFAMLFLASVYGEEDDEVRRKQIERVLTKAVEFSGKAQSNRGGWYYVSAADCGDSDEGSTTITQVQALRAARNAGIVVPKSIIDKSVKYLKDSTTPRGGIIYSLSMGGGQAQSGQERPAITAAAVACSFSSGDYSSEYAKKWIKYCKESIPIGKGRQSHDEYQSYYLAQALYVLGDDGYGKLFPGSRKEDQMTWSKFKEGTFETIKGSQNRDGSWTSGYIGPVYTTAINLTILQLEKATLPIYQR